MASKDAFLPKSQHSILQNVGGNNHFSNLNLNQNRKCLNQSFVHSNNKSISNIKDFDSKVVNNEKRSSSLWQKSSSNTLHSKPFKSFSAFDEAEENAKPKRWKNDSSDATTTRSSTLSLHIAAYENLIEGEHTVTSDKKEGLKKDLIKERKQVSINSTLLQNPFEFPRQQTDGESDPAVMQFKSSQKLFGPNQSNSPNKIHKGPQNVCSALVHSNQRLPPPPAEHMGIVSIMSPMTEAVEVPADAENKAGENNTFIFKKLFSDFIVIEKFGENLCGTWPTNVLKPYDGCIKVDIPHTSPEFLTKEDNEEMSKLLEAKDGTYLVPLSADLNTKENRKALHLYIRDHYNNMLSSVSIDEGVQVSYAKIHKKDTRIQWPEGLGKFLHFTLKKTDHENSHALNCIARCIGATSKLFQFAGTKDRRAITYQRISAFKVISSKFTTNHDRLLNQGIELSEFSYEDTPIKMGSHTSNIFQIVLRNAEIDVDRFEKVKSHGCFNIFGPQRFGSVSGNTAEIGKLILHERYEDAVNNILNPDACIHGNLKRILTKYAEVKNASVLRNTPGFMSKFNEVIVIRALQKFSEQSDKYFQALLQLPRHVRSLYVHAYQSKMFNQFIERFKEKHPLEDCPDISVPLPDHSLTAEEHPEVFEVYTDLLAKDGLTLESFKKHEANFALHFTTRNILLKPKSMDFKVLEHADLDAPFVFYPPSKEKPDYGKGHQSVFITFELSPGSYATTVLTALFDREFKTGSNDITE